MNGIPYSTFKKPPLECIKDLEDGIVYDDRDGRFCWEFPIPKGGVAQVVEHLIEDQSVRGANPFPTT